MADGWGGARQGTPGKGYSNRTDMLTNRAAAGSGPTAASGGQAVQPSPMVGPDQVPSPRTPSAYPDEPVTAGLPSGAGPGPEALPMNVTQPNSEVVNRLRALILADPTNPDLRRLLARAQIGQR